MILRQKLNKLTEDEWVLLWYVVNFIPETKVPEIPIELFHCLRSDVLSRKMQIAQTNLNDEGKLIFNALAEKIK